MKKINSKLYKHLPIKELKSKKKKNSAWGKTIYLKSTDVEVVSVQSTHAIDGSDVGVSVKERNTEADIGLHFFRAKHAEEPTYDGSPVMSHKEDLFDTQRLYKRNEIAHYVKAGIAGD